MDFYRKFISKVSLDSSTNCWNWTDKCDDKGYGRFWDGKTLHRAHRYAYFLYRSEIKDSSLVIDHLCRNRQCVNPYHLELVSHKTNILRGIGLAAQNTLKTHCTKGHPYSGSNLRINCYGHRVCIQCAKFHGKQARNRKSLKDNTLNEA